MSPTDPHAPLSYAVPATGPVTHVALRTHTIGLTNQLNQVEQAAVIFVAAMRDQITALEAGYDTLPAPAAPASVVVVEHPVPLGTLAAAVPAPVVPPLSLVDDATQIRLNLFMGAAKLLTRALGDVPAYPPVPKVFVIAAPTVVPPLEVLPEPVVEEPPVPVPVVASTVVPEPVPAHVPVVEVPVAEQPLNA
jgi:hypothetical protein